MAQNDSFKTLFPGNPKALIGMVHLQALPGTPCARITVSEVISRAVAEAKALVEAGFHAVIVENMHDRPYVKGSVSPEVTAVMAVTLAGIKAAVSIPVGVQVLAGANREAIAAALAAGADFIRAEGFVFAHIADEGWMDGCAGALLRYRKSIGADQILIFTDIKKKHSSHSVTADVSIVETAHAAEFFLSDGVIVTGASTGTEVDLDELKRVSKSVKIPVLIGSGITAGNIQNYYRYADAFIVGSAIKRDGHWANELDGERMRTLVSAFKACREAGLGK